MTGADEVRRNRALQRQFYGEPLGDRLRRLLVALDISQNTLAETLGLSPTMLSQLMSARRAKIGTPAVHGRLVLLERRVATPEVASGDRRAIEVTLAEVRHAHPTVGVESYRGRRGDEVAYGVLRSVAEADDLARAADTLSGGFPGLAAFLRRAADAG
jgi:DNA-binding transcriptional regulator YdaS (Cro superfamily)